MKNNSLTTLTTIAIGLAVALLIYIGNISLGQCFQRLEDSKMAQRQYKILDLLHSIKFDLHQAVIAEHEFIWGQDKKFVDSYESNMASALERITKLDIELRGKYQMTSDELKEYVSVHKKCSHEAFDLSRSKGSQAAFAYLKEQGQEKLSTEIEDLIDNLEGRTSMEFGLITTQADKGSMQTVTGIAGLMCVALFILIIVIVVVNRYVNERQRAERSLQEAERRFRAVFNQTFQLSFLLAPDGTIIEVNESFADFANIAEGSKELHEKMFWEGSFWLNRENNINRLKEAVEKAAKGQTVRLEEEIKGSKGEVITVDLSIKPVLEDRTRVLFLIAEARDITERKQAEQRVKEFYSTVSHELRTPLTAIRTALGLMDSLTEDSKAKPVLVIAEEETDRLIRLINNILDIRKIESGKVDLKLSQVEPSAILKKSIDSLENLAKENKIGFETRLESQTNGSHTNDSTISADEDKLQQVITNLLSNAIKWAPEGSKVLVKVKQSKSLCRFEISDEGPGIPEEQREIIFDQFQQIKGKNLPPGGSGGKGTGLGLAISKALVEQHGGSIGVLDREGGQGSCFWFELPCKEEPVCD